MDFAKIGPESFAALIIGAALAIALPIAVALIWKFKKNEPITSILIGAATFLLFALILEKPLQALVISIDHPVSRFLNANPVLWALVVGLFPGIFEETGRFVAFRTLLKNRKNRETSISHGIGHGGFEVIIILGLTYITYISYAIMINSGLFGTIVDQVAAQAPDQVGAITALADQLSALTIADIGLAFVERIFACLFYVGASILVFYACRDKSRLWLYPLAILIHTAMDFIAGLSMAHVVDIPVWGLEGIFAAFGILTFVLAYFLLYRRDSLENS